MRNICSPAAVRLQVYDWLKDATPEEERAMQLQGWDTDGVKLGPVRQRYRQPCLIINDAAHARVATRARRVMARLEGAAEELRVRGLLRPG